ncbi:MAG TPA: O-antigen ligase family protein [Luteimonas sp.]|nr:O-antigen ligase family protein [Luteimonas sp.]
MTNSPTNPADAVAAAPAPAGWRWAPYWVLAFVALWPAPGIAEGVLVLGALAAIVKLLATRFRGGTRLLSGPAWALTSALFFAYWLPQLLSAFDAFDARHAFYKAATALRYLPFLWLVASAVADRRGRRITFGGLAVIVAVWTLDALAQALSGTSPLFWGLDALKQLIEHKPMCSPQEIAAVDRLSGVLGPCNLKLGIVLASLSPFALYVAGRRFGSVGWIVAAALVGVVILLGGARASWLTYALVLVFSGWRLLGWKKLLGMFAFGGVLLLALSLTVPQVRERIQRTSQALAADETGLDSALSGRGRIWGAALCMAREHPVNGVGARSFREAFPACDPEPDQIPAWGSGPAFHAHQIVLEILSETGLLGLLLWLSGAALAWRAWRYADEGARDRARPAMLALAVTVFPFNTHLAFYSTFWGGLTLLLAALFAGSLLAKRQE